MSHEANAPVPAELNWTVWPARHQPLLSLAVAAFCLAVSWWAMTYMGSPWWAFLTLLALSLALSDHFFPTRYHLTPTGLERRGPGYIDKHLWSAFRLTTVLPDRLVLYRHGSVAGWLARRRAIPLRFAGNSDQVLAYVRRHVPVEDEKD